MGVCCLRCLGRAGLSHNSSHPGSGEKKLVGPAGCTVEAGASLIGQQPLCCSPVVGVGGSPFSSISGNKAGGESARTRLWLFHGACLAWESVHCSPARRDFVENEPHVSTPVCEGKWLTLRSWGQRRGPLMAI